MRYQINNFLIKLLCRKLRLPKYYVYNALIFINKVTLSKQHHFIHSSLDSRHSKSVRADYLLFDKNDNDSLEGIINTCKAIYQDKISTISASNFQNNPKKNFLLTLDSDENLLSFPEINKFITSDFVIDNVSSMLQSSFIINSARLWWTPANATEVSSQLYHFDEEDLTQVKLFINILNVSTTNGPFTFLPSDISTTVTTQYKNGKRRFTDQEVYAYIDKENMIQLVGESGSGAFIDTSQCMHYGSRRNEADRLVFMVQFLRTNAPFITRSIAI